MKQRICLVIIGFIIFLTNNKIFAEFSFDDFVAPIEQKQTEKAEEARKIKSKVEVLGNGDLKAKSINDGCNTAIKLDEAKDKCTIINLPNGEFAVLSSASSNYNIYKNPDATTASKRMAFQEAYNNAKVKMATFLEGRKGDKSLFGSEFDSEETITEEGNKNNTVRKTTESIQNQIKGLLKGYIIYDMGEKNGSVWVSIVSSKKTRNIWNRESDSCFTSDSMEVGIQRALTEIQKGMIPIGGAKIINYKNTNKEKNVDGFVIMGFGSAQVLHYSNINAQRNSDYANKQKAQMRAEEELLKAIKGDYIQFDRESQESNKQDNNFFNSWSKLRTRYKTEMNGSLPPGVTSLVDKTADGNWFIGIAIWMPAAQKFANDLKKY